ncbi:MAG: alpha-xylosidase [Betaproteobacteria bacterium AqS2]|uniref:Alpha-xylosidase n=1 Tax=Candidatus Amphirhobacter heronislandensis TaxID=1732024 RepID=A0A930UIQ3_9GAMM|nr:alpha-xylosidase [Betaproteobacteria bacterium AqS2]
MPRPPDLAAALTGLPPLRRTRPPRLAGGVLRVPTTAGTLTIERWRPGILRLRLPPPAGAPKAPDYGLLAGRGQPRAGRRTADGGWDFGDFGVQVEPGEQLALSISHRGRPLLGPPSDGHFTRRWRIAPWAADAERAAVAFDLADGERLHGGGENWARLDLRGQLLDGWNEDSLGGNAAQSYKNIPFVWSSRGWGLWFNTPAPVRQACGFAALSHRSYVAAAARGLDLFVLAGTPAEMLRGYHRLTGAPGVLPAWSLEPWLSRAYYRTEAELLEAAEKMRALRLPCRTIVLDGRTWLRTRTRFAFDWDEERYPDFPATLARLKKMGYRVCLWVYPLCSVHSPAYADLARAGMFLRDRRGRSLVYRFDPEPFGADLSQLPPSGVVDFTNPRACRWWRRGCARLLELGADALKTDFGEQVPAAAVAANGDRGWRLHNAYALLYNQQTALAFAAAGKKPVLWARAAASGSQRHPGHWCGDSQSDWGGLRTAVRGCLQWSLSGGAYTGSDVGGFYGGPPDPELYLRWLQFGVMSPLLRLHGIGPREPYHYGARVLRASRAWLELRMRLLPYLRRAARQIPGGLPLLRPLPLAYPELPAEASGRDLQFLLGPDLLCAPVTEPGGRKELWLPPGRWRDVLSGETVAGPRLLTRRCRLEEAPLYARAGRKVL